MRPGDYDRAAETVREAAAQLEPEDMARMLREAHRLRRLAGLPDGRHRPARGRMRRTNREPLPPGKREAGMIGTREAARMLDTTPAYIRTLVQREQIPYYKPRGRLMFDPAELEGWRKRRTGPESTANGP